MSKNSFLNKITRGTDTWKELSSQVTFRVKGLTVFWWGWQLKTDAWSSSVEEQRVEKTCPCALQQNNLMAGGAVPANYEYPPAARLRKRSEFLRLKDSTQKFACRGILVVWQANNLAHARLGVTVSKKIGCAVTRNRVKRFVRETFRYNRLILPAVDLNVIARSDAATMDFHGLELQLLKAFRHIGASPCSKVSHS